MARKAMSKKMRFEVFKRDSFTCQYCGAVPPKVILHVDHINPVKHGGRNEMDNLVTSCSECNLGKSATLLSSIPKSLSDKAEEIKEREEQIKGYAEVMSKKRDRLEQEKWMIAEVIEPGCGESGCKKDYLLSIRNFIEKIGYYEVLDAAEIAAAAGIYSDNRRFRYFFGICWNKVREAD